MGRVANYLNQLVVGNVFDAPEVLEAYSTDRSVMQVKPKIVALPESTDDVQKIMKFFYQLSLKDVKIQITARGTGLDTMGADLSNGLVLSTEKLNHLLEMDKRERLVRVQAGITLRELNTALSVNGMTIPIGGCDNNTIGGLISTCPTDAYAGKYGGIMNYVERIEAVLANGEVLQTSRLTNRQIVRKNKDKSLTSDIYRKINKLVDANNETINNIRQNGLGSAGYPTITQAKRKGTLDLMPLFFGAEGTLGVITEVILRAVPIKKEVARVVATFEDFNMAKKFLDFVQKDLKPRELNIYDMNILKTAEGSGKRLREITKKVENGFAIFASFDDKPASALRKIAGIRKVLPKSTQLIMESKDTKIILDEFENSLASFLNNIRNGERVPLVTDFSLSSDNLESFLGDIKLLEDKFGMNLWIFGSYSGSNYSLRPKFNLANPTFNKKATTFLRTAGFIIERQGGSLTGGSPEGRVKAIVTNDNLNEKERFLYNEIKKIFDHNGILNPSVKLGADPQYTVRHFRSTSSAKVMI